ncbi:transcription intermediary factor 1-beta-like [Littorina saxatilis]|uniref:Uncharacterized protein n=1 Tax=Littorina saxatilis TaxID=31220 RepID=A0AAN9AIM9_9CAEN
MATAPASTSSSPLECPVCHETFDEPKMLPCTHLVCTKCILSWLAKAGATAGCPLCRAPVLSPSRQGHHDLEAEVKRLPTDLVTVAVVDSQRVLAAPHVCDMCPNNVTADSYCFQCAVKLCKTCTNYHKKLPVSKGHTLEDLHKLTQSRLIASQRVTCKSHPDRPAELYCPAHREVICILCGTTGHGNCRNKKTIEDVATKRRAELKQETQSLRDMEAVINTQMNEAKDKLNVMRWIANDTFDDLEQCLRKRRQEVNQLIQAEEDVTMTSLAEPEKSRAALALNAGSMENLLDSASSSALLAMASDLVSRLSEVKSQSGTVGRVEVADLTLDDLKLNQLKAHIASLGQMVKAPTTTVTTPQLSATTPPALSTSTSVTTPQNRDKPRRAELAKVLRLGDRVRRGPDMPSYATQDEGEPGTVIAVPLRAARRGMNSTGWVHVRWDTGLEGWHRMGKHNQFDLDLM